MSKPAPEQLPSGDMLCGTGNRFIKLGFVHINVYHFALYAHAQGLRRALKPDYGGKSLSDFQGSEAFYHALVMARFRKTLVLTMYRALPRGKMLASFTKSLLSRVDVAQHAEAKRLIERLVPTDFQEDDKVTLQLEADGESIIGSVNGRETIRVKGPGPDGIWVGFQNIFFDLNTEVLDVKRNAIEKIPALLRGRVAARADPGPTAAAMALAAPPSQTATAARPTIPSEALAVAEAKPSRATDPKAAAKHTKYESLLHYRPPAKSWKLRAGRDDGNEGYQLGDLTRAVWRKMFAEEPEIAAVDKNYTRRIKEVLDENEALEARVRELSAELDRKRSLVLHELGRAYLLGAFFLACLILFLFYTLQLSTFEHVLIMLWGVLGFFSLELSKSSQDRAAKAAAVATQAAAGKQDAAAAPPAIQDSSSAESAASDPAARPTGPKKQVHWAPEPPRPSKPSAA